MKHRIVSKALLFAGLALLALPAAPRLLAAEPAAAPASVAPAGIADYSYIEVRRLYQGSSVYLGDSAKGNGAKFSFQFGEHTYFYASYARLQFDDLPGYLYRTGVGVGYQQTVGRVSAFVRIGYYREMLSASLGGARSYYYEPAYGLRAAFGDHFYLQGEIYTDFHPDFGSRPWGVKFGAAGVFGPVSLHLVLDHNRDANSLMAALRFAF
ncbi:MAG: hypothetical protein L0I62_04445 [Gammaproteobacteria bacterium]|nr:hypothetical protein [Gammaproteobacteria bacterium]